MNRIDIKKVQRRLDALKNTDVYLHMEMTMGAYTSHRNKNVHPASNFIKNVVIKYAHGTLSEESPHRVGLKLNGGWVYAEGMTHWDEADEERLILAGNDKDGKLIAALQLSKEPF